jgi:hypothetical protein
MGFSGIWACRRRSRDRVLPVRRPMLERPTRRVGPTIFLYSTRLSDGRPAVSAAEVRRAACERSSAAPAATRFCS